jgi:hypothetical protein
MLQSVRRSRPWPISVHTPPEPLGSSTGLDPHTSPQTYDNLADRDIPWQEKKQWTDRAVKYYLTQVDIPRSSAPLDVTMRRAGVMMKPYES